MHTRHSTRYAEVVIAAQTGAVSAEVLVDPLHPSRGSVSRIRPLEKALQALADGGYVIDLRPLAEHPQLSLWVALAPMPNGRIEGEGEPLSDDTRQTASDMLPWLEGNFQILAAWMAKRIGEPADPSAGPFDVVPSAVRAAYWGKRGARIGKRIGDAIHWSDGTHTPVPVPDEPEEEMSRREE